MATKKGGMNKFQVECKADRQAIHKLLKNNSAEHLAITDTLREINITLGHMNSIRINGDEMKLSLEDAFRELYKATKEIRARKKLKESFQEWKKLTALGRVFDTKLGKFLIIFVGTFTVISVLHVLGVIPVEPIGLIVKCVLFLQGIL